MDESTVGGVPEHMVAAKQVKDTSGAKELIREAIVMAQVTPHRNVLPLIGVVTTGSPLMLLAPYCEHGSLQSLLRGAELDDQVAITPERKRAFSVDIALGMQHLTEQRFVHRDLAARNVLVRALVLVLIWLMVGSGTMQPQWEIPEPTCLLAQHMCSAATFPHSIPLACSTSTIALGRQLALLQGFRLWAESADVKDKHHGDHIRPCVGRAVRALK